MIMSIKPVIIFLIEKHRSIRHRNILITCVHYIADSSYRGVVPDIREMIHYRGKVIWKDHYLCIFVIKDVKDGIKEKGTLFFNIPSSIA